MLQSNHGLRGSPLFSDVAAAVALALIILTVLITFILSVYQEHVIWYNLSSNRNDVQPALPQAQCLISVPDLQGQKDLVVLTKPS